MFLTYTSLFTLVPDIFLDIFLDSSPLRGSLSHSRRENKPRGLYFSKAVFEGLIFGGAYLRREICVSKSIGLVGSKFTIFALFYFVFEGNFPSTSPRGLILGGAI